MDYHNRENWIEARTKTIGASDAAAALGLSEWKSPYTLWCEKTGRLKPEDIGNVPAVRWGNLHEPTIRSEVGVVLKQEVRHPGDYFVLNSCKVPFMSATLDGVLEANEMVDEVFHSADMVLPDDGDGVLQIKTTSQWNADKFDDYSFPLNYRVQTAHELEVSSYSWGILAVLVGNCDLRMIPYERNLEFATEMVAAERDFWELVQSDEEPEVDGSMSTRQTLKSMYPADDGNVVELPADADEWDDIRLEAIERKKDALELIAMCDAKIVRAIGDATVGRLPNGSEYSWKLQNRKPYTAKASSFRVLRRRK